jgi:hypothetical protein
MYNIKVILNSSLEEPAFNTLASFFLSWNFCGSKSHCPTILKSLFRKRLSIERANSRLKSLIGLRVYRLKGLRNMTAHVLYCIFAM